MNFEGLTHLLPQVVLTSSKFANQLIVSMNLDDLNEQIADLSPAKRALLELRLKQKNRGTSAGPTISRRRDRSSAPLSFGQQRLWFLNQLDPSNPAYNIAHAFRIKGPLNVSTLKAALNELVRRHEVLRTRFAIVDGEPIQLIDENSSVSLNIIESPDAESEVRSIATEQAKRPFDLANGPLFRAHLFVLANDDHVLLTIIHHIVSDGWSMRVLFGELSTLYEAFANGRSSPLPDLPIQYADFALWQREWLQGEVLEKRLSYWKQQLEGAPALLELPLDRPRPAVQSFRGAHHPFSISESLARDIKALSRQEEVTLFMTVLAAYQLLLYRHAKQEHIVVGSPIANRSGSETERLIGFFINTLLLHTDLSGNPTFRELLRRVKEVALGAYAHQDMPFEKLVEELHPERSASHSALFQTWFVFQNAPRSALELPGLNVSSLKLDAESVRHDLSLAMWETDQALAGTWTYNTDLFDASTIERMSGRFETLLQSIVDQPDARLHALPMLSEAERNEQASQKQDRKDLMFKKLMNVKPKAISVKQESLVQEDYLEPGGTLPLVLRPTLDGLNLITWATRNRDFLEANLLKHGGILFRGFNLVDVSEFERFINTISGSLLEYSYRSTPRTQVSGRIYTSTEYPADQSIPLHNEMAYSRNWPMKIWFFCVHSAAEGGETPIADSRKVFSRIDPKIRDRFIDKQVMYVRNYGDGLDLSWENVFQTTNKPEVEEYCRRVGIEFQWTRGNGLRTRQLCQAVAKHPQTGEMSWFNQAHLFHISSLGAEVRESLLAEFKEEDLPRNACYGDGSRIEDDVLDEIREIYAQEEVAFAWQPGDILMLDNMLTAHGRRPFVGPRKVVVGMAEAFNREEPVLQD